MSLLDPHVNRSSLIGESYDLFAAPPLRVLKVLAHRPECIQISVVRGRRTVPIQAALDERRFPAVPPDPTQGASAIDFLFSLPNQDPMRSSSR